jgi:hypothetical protein
MIDMDKKTSADNTAISEAAEIVAVVSSADGKTSIKPKTTIKNIKLNEPPLLLLFQGQAW